MIVNVGIFVGAANQISTENLRRLHCPEAFAGNSGEDIAVAVGLLDGVFYGNGADSGAGVLRSKQRAADDLLCDQGAGAVVNENIFALPSMARMPL